jgi:hypothetical protein
MDTKMIEAGRSLGVLRLTHLIQKCEKEKSEIAFRVLKRVMQIKGDRAGVLKFAREVLASVNEW